MEMFGLPMNMVMQYLVPLLSIPALMLFKYGKQRGYLLDLVMFHSKPHVYSALERDAQLVRELPENPRPNHACDARKVRKAAGGAALCEQLRIRDLLDDVAIPARWIVCGRL